MVDLPYDVWAAIAHYIEEEKLLALASVHPAFLSIVLDTRYREIWWVKLDESMVSVLSRLQDPSIAQRVRRLHIRAWFIEFLLKQAAPVEPAVEVWGVQDWVSAFWGWAAAGEPQSQEAQPPIRKPHDISLEKRLGTMSSPGEIIRAMVTAIGGMVNVIAYDFEWRDLPLNNDTQIFLITTRTAFDTSLTKLVLSARISKLAEILVIMDFKRLEELEFNFEYDPISFNNDGSLMDEAVASATNRDLLAKRVAPFINHLSPSLRSLTISSSALGDHSQFFHTLSFLPALRLLVIQMPFDGKHLTDPAGLFRILHAHISTLLALELRPTDLDRNAPKNSVLGRTRQNLLDIFHHPRLESLAIPSLDQEMTVSLVKRTAETLTSLTLSGRFLSINEVIEIVDIFATRSKVSQLTHLSLEVQAVPPRLLDTLANGLPGLLSLTLIIDQQYSDLQRHNSGTEYQRYTDWKLSSVSIYLRNQRPDTINVIPYTGNEFETMAQLWMLIPSIRWLKGQGQTSVLSKPRVPTKEDYVDVNRILPGQHGAVQRYTAAIQQRQM